MDLIRRISFVNIEQVYRLFSTSNGYFLRQKRALCKPHVMDKIPGSCHRYDFGISEEKPWRCTSRGRTSPQVHNKCYEDY